MMRSVAVTVVLLVVFGLLFDDGSEGVFTSNIAIPEPAGLALALAAGGLLLRRRRA